MKKLDRELGLVSVVAIAIGSMIGGGIFVLPGLAAAITGPSVWLAYLLAGVLVFPAALSKSEMATAMPKAGGAYVFVDRSMGPLYGTVAGLGTWLAMLFKAAFALVGISVYLSMFTSVSYQLVSVLLLCAVVALNVMGIKKVGKAQLIVVFLCLASLSVLLFQGASAFQWQRLTPHFSGGGWGLLATTGLVFLSYAGVTKIASIAEEIVDPERNVPLAMILSLVIMMVLYSLVALMLVGVLPMKSMVAGRSLSGSETAIALLGQALFGRPGVIAMATIAVIALASMANAGLLAASRYPLAMSRDGMMPKAFQSIHPGYGTPIFSIVFTAACMGLSILFLPVLKIAKLASGMQVLLFLGNNVAVLLLRETHPDWYKPSFRAPLYPWMQLFGIAGSLLLLAMLGVFVLFGTACLLLAGTLWFFLYARRNTSRRGVLQKLVSKPPPLSAEDDEDTDDAEVQQTQLVVPLSGNEFSPESLLAIGSTLGASKLSVVKIDEIPDQVVLSQSLLDETPKMKALKRRIHQMARSLEVKANVDFIASHDSRHALYEYINKSGASWVLVDMGAHKQFHKMRRYLGWLTRHLPCNLVFYQDEGLRITQHILVYIDKTPTQESDRLHLKMADNLARLYRANVTLLCVIPEDATAQEADEARQRLNDCKDCFRTEDVISVLKRGRPEHVVIEESIAYDLLVMDFPTQAASYWPWRSVEADLLMEQVACSMLSVRPALAQSDAVLLKAPLSHTNIKPLPLHRKHSA